MGSIPEMVGWYGAFVLSVTLHECFHAWAAKLGGDLTAYEGGQVSIDPIPHIRREPVGMVVLPIISLFLIGWPFGYASTPYDPYWAQRHPRKAAWMAAAGPAANLLLLLLCAAAVHIGILLGMFAVPESVEYTSITAPTSDGITSVAATMVSILFTMNLILTLFNLMPLPPLDGSEVVTLFMSEQLLEKYRRIMKTPIFAIAGLLLVWHVFSPIFRVVFIAVINLLYPGHRYG